MTSFTFNFRAAVITVVAAALLSVALRGVAVQAGFSLPGEPVETWVGDVARYRESIYRNDASNVPTIWIVAGSNALFGTDSGVLADRTGYSVKNYALHAGMNQELLFSQIRGKIRPNDVVVMPTEWVVRDQIAFSVYDYSNYIRHFSSLVNLRPQTLIDLYMSIPLERWTTGFVSYLYAPENAVDYWEQRPISLLEEIRTQVWDGNVYSVAALTSVGDINVDRAMSNETWWGATDLAIPATVTEAGLVRMKSWAAEVEQAGAKLLTLAPIMLQTQSGYLTERSTWQAIESIRAQMASFGVPLHCDPVQATYAAAYRLDTIYHANASGAKLRSEEMASCLNAYIRGEDVRAKPIDAEEAITRVNARMALQRENFGFGSLPIQERLRRLAKLNAAILSYHATNGVYPIGDIASVSARLGQGVDPDTFSYWADGQHYRLLAITDGSTCGFVAANWPGMVYPSPAEAASVQACAEYGFWS